MSIIDGLGTHVCTRKHKKNVLYWPEEGSSGVLGLRVPRSECPTVRKNLKSTIQVYSVTVMTHFKALKGRGNLARGHFSLLHQDPRLGGAIWRKGVLHVYFPFNPIRGV